MDEILDITPDAVFNAVVTFMRTTGKSPTELNVSGEAERQLKAHLSSLCCYEAKEGGQTFMGLQIVGCDFGWHVA